MQSGGGSNEDISQASMSSVSVSFSLFFVSYMVDAVICAEFATPTLELADAIAVQKLNSDAGAM